MIEASDLSVPIYLNQQTVFDLLAVFEGGFSQLRTIKTSSGESDTQRHGAGGSIGVSNVFAFLGVTLTGQYEKERGSQEQTEMSEQKVHTPTSLFAKLRLRLKEEQLLRTIGKRDELATFASGDFVEFRALLRKNPLVDTVEALKQLMELSVLFSDDQTSGKRGKSSSQKNNNQVVMRQMDAMLAALGQSNSIELVGELLDVPDVKAVLTARLDFFSQGTASEVIDGEFRVLGKIVRVVTPDSGETISLLRKTSFARFDQKYFAQLAEVAAASEQLGIHIPLAVTHIEGPAIQVLPIAVFL